MINEKVQAIILAAGKSARFNTENSKLVAPICGKEMIIHTTTLLEQMNINTTLVVGYKKDLIQEAITRHHPNTTFEYVTQNEQLGSGHALRCSKHLWNKEHILVMNGDAPLLTQATLQRLIDEHFTAKSALSFLVAYNVDPSVRGYGHVIQNGKHIKIVEDRHMNHEHLDSSNLNAGVYIFKKSFLLKHIDSLPRHEISKEYYLTTLIEIASTQGLRVCTVDASFDEARGVNTLKELWVAEQIKRSRLIEYWMSHGVHFSCAHQVHIDEGVKIGPATRIEGSIQLFGNTQIGARTTLGAFTVLENAKIGDNCVIAPHVIIKESTIGNHCTINSFSYIHQKSTVHDNCSITSFTELNNQIIHNCKEASSKKKDKTFLAAFKTIADQSFTESI